MHPGNPGEHQPGQAALGQKSRTARHFVCAFFGAGSELWHVPVSQAVSPQPPVTQDIETVEKWERNTEKCLVFGLPHNISAIFWHFFSLLWVIFMNIFEPGVFDSLFGQHNIHRTMSNDNE
jgi:hypothetical protein